jgi:hypothetical protein
MASLGHGQGQQQPPLPGVAIPGNVPPPQQGNERDGVPYSNIYEQYKNWEDSHTSITCPFQRVNHQVGYTWANAQKFIAAGYNPYTMGIHKLVLPRNRNALRRGANILSLAHKCKSVFSTTSLSLDPTFINSASSPCNDDTATVVTLRSWRLK